MGVEARVDVFDLIINAISDHERRFEELVSKLEKTMEKTTSSAAPAGAHVKRTRSLVAATLRSWQEFKKKCLGSGIAAFDIEEKRLRVSAVKDDVLYTYQEEISDIEIRFGEIEERAIDEGIDAEGEASVPTFLGGRLKCGLEVFVNGFESKLQDGVVVYNAVYDLKVEDARAWMARQLKTNKRNVIQGKLVV